MVITELDREAEAQWMEKAECRGMPIDLWFPHGGQAKDGVYTKPKAICSKCPVQQQCQELWKSLDSRQKGFGMWFGTTPKDRNSNRPLWK